LRIDPGGFGGVRGKGLNGETEGIQQQADTEKHGEQGEKLKNSKEGHGKPPGLKTREATRKPDVALFSSGFEIRPLYRKNVAVSVAVLV